MDRLNQMVIDTYEKGINRINELIPESKNIQQIALGLGIIIDKQTKKKELFLKEREVEVREKQLELEKEKFESGTDIDYMELARARIALEQQAINGVPDRSISDYE